MVVSEVECAIMAAVKNTISSAGSARKETSISRRAPSVPKEVPISIAASGDEHARQGKNADQRDHVDRRQKAAGPPPTTGTIAAASHMLANRM